MQLDGEQKNKVCRVLKFHGFWLLLYVYLQLQSPESQQQKNYWTLQIHE